MNTLRIGHKVTGQWLPIAENLNGSWVMKPSLLDQFVDLTKEDACVSGETGFVFFTEDSQDFDTFPESKRIVGRPDIEKDARTC